MADTADETGLQPGDPIPPERTGGMTGFVVGNCGHRLAGSEWAAGYRNCERCGEDSQPEDDETPDYDPGPEIDDQGGMSEYRHATSPEGFNA